MRVQIGDNQFGFVRLMDTSDQWLAEPFKTFKVGDYCIGRIIKKDDGNIYVSTRATITNNKFWQSALSPYTGTQVKFNELFREE